MSEVDPAIVKAIEELIGKGQFDQALLLGNKLVDSNPCAADSWYWVGQVQLLRGELAAAENALQEAVRLDALAANAWTVLSLVTLSLGRAEDAERQARRAVELDSSKDFVWMNFGSALFQQEKWAEAADAYRRAVSLGPGNAAAWSSLASAEHKLGRREETQAAFERSLSLAPNPVTAVNYSLLLMERGQIQQAAHVLRQVIAQVSTLGVAWLAWGDVQGLLGDPVEAERAYRRVLEIEPGHRQSQLNLAAVLHAQFRLAEAEAAARQLVTANVGDAEAWAMLGSIQQAGANIPEALESFRRSCDAAPAPGRHSSWLLAMQYAADAEPMALLAAHQQWDERFARGLSREQAVGPTNRGSKRPLRIGFVSANFIRHPVAFLLLPILEHLDRSQATVVLYHDRFDEDFYTNKFQAAADAWNSVGALSDDELAALVRQDEIDVLIDLMGHTGRRLPVFARRPAAVQATWLGYPGTTGLAAMDYLIADRFHVRPGEESWYQEKVLRLPNSYAVYGPPPYIPAVNELPAKKKGWITFGSLSNPAKFSPLILDAWAEILKRTANTRLLLGYAGLNEAEVQAPLRKRFAERGIPEKRLILKGTASHPKFLAYYHEIDVALDTQPYSGGVTTCEALWTGVPVITCPGKTFAGRHATSYLSTAGLTEFVGADISAYIETAVRWADRIDELSNLRSDLRNRVSQSPLGDAKQFAADLVRALATAHEASRR